MKAFRMLPIITLAFLWMGCSRNDNGTYVVYKVEHNHKAFYQWAPWGNDTIKAFLQHELTGKQLVLNFKDKYVSMGNPSNPMQYILTKEYDRGRQVYYHLEVSKSGVTFTFRMRRDSIDGILLAVDMEHEKGASLFSPVQLGSKVLGAVYEDRAVCYLEKL